MTTVQKTIIIIGAAVAVVVGLGAVVFLVLSANGGLQQKNTPLLTEGDPRQIGDRLAPCSLLTPVEQTTLGIGAGEARDYPNGLDYRQCLWTSDNLSITAQLTPNGTLENKASWQTSDVIHGTSGSHQTLTIPDSEDTASPLRKTCEMGIQLSIDNHPALLDLIISTRDGEPACDVTKRVTALIEPRLP